MANRLPIAESDQLGIRQKVLFPKDLPEKWILQEPLLVKLGASGSLDDVWSTLTELYCVTRGCDPRKVDLITKTPFVGLKKYFAKLGDPEVEECFVKKVIPFLSNLVLEVHDLIPENGLIILGQHQSGFVKLSRKCVAGIVATGFLIMFPKNVAAKSPGEKEIPGECLIPGMNFDNFFRRCYASSQKAKLECILHYFKKLADSRADLCGNVIYKRVVLEECDLLELSSLEESATPLCPLYVYPEGKIEDAGSQVLQVDFANEYLGGGVLEEGNVQEEIRFSICPELLGGMLFLECMLPNEAIVIRGFEQFSDYKGYGGSFSFDGDYNDESVRDSNGNIATEICAIDAVPYVWGLGGKSQYEIPHMTRDLNKAYAGFLQRDASEWAEEELEQERNSACWYLEMDPDKKRVVATGNWGCGVFGGNPQLKSLLQWVAASHACCPAILYYTFKNPDLQGMEEFVSKVMSKGWTVGMLVKALTYACNTKTSNIFELIVTQSQL